jgi:hypothetical protein
MEIIEFAIICALLLWIWYSGGFSKKSQKSNIPVPSNCYPGCVCYSLVNQQPVTENLAPVVLPAVHEDGETTESDNDRLPPETLPQPLSYPEAVIAAAITDQTEPADTVGEFQVATEVTEKKNVPLEADLTHQEAVTGQDSIVPDIPSPESPSPKRFKFQLTQLPYLPDGYYITLSLNERGTDGKMKKTKILSTRNPQSTYQKSVSFDVHNTEEATLTTKMKKTSLFGLMKFTLDVKETDKLGNMDGKDETELLPDFFEEKERKKELAKKKREERKLKGRLASCEQYGIDPYVRMGSDETFGLGQKKEKINIITDPEIKPKKISFWVRHGFLYPKDRYTRRRFE